MRSVPWSEQVWRKKYMHDIVTILHIFGWIIMLRKGSDAMPLKDMLLLKGRGGRHVNLTKIFHQDAIKPSSDSIMLFISPWLFTG